MLRLRVRLTAPKYSSVEEQAATASCKHHSRSPPPGLNELNEPAPQTSRRACLGRVDHLRNDSLATGIPGALRTQARTSMAGLMSTTRQQLILLAVLQTTVLKKIKLGAELRRLVAACDGPPENKTSAELPTLAFTGRSSCVIHSRHQATNPAGCPLGALRHHAIWLRQLCALDLTASNIMKVQGSQWPLLLQQAATESHLRRVEEHLTPGTANNDA